MVDHENLDQEMEIVGEKVIPVKKLQQVTVVDAVKFIDGNGEIHVYKVGDKFSLLDGTESEILKIKASYDSKTVGLIYEKSQYKDEQTGFEFPLEKIFGIVGYSFEAMTHDEVISSLDKKATMHKAQMQKQEKEMAAAKELTDAQAKENESTTATPEGVEQGAEENQASENTEDNQSEDEKS